MIRTILTGGLTALALAGCVPAPPPAGGAGAAPAQCWAEEVTPAVIETVTRQVLDRPEQRDAAGRVTVPAAYRTETRQEIVRPRGPFRFRVPCPAEMDAAFVAALQRALAARGHYAGPVTGEMDPATRRAVRRFQAPFGYDTATLSLEAARRMGLAVYAPPPPRILPQ